MRWTTPADGTLLFPVTPFDRHGAVGTEVLRAFIAARLNAAPVAAIFAACGTGEFHALGAREVGQVVEVAAEQAGATPVIAGAGGPLGHAIDCGRIAGDCGATALLVMPPYLVGCSSDGMRRYIEALVRAVDLPVIVYNRPPVGLDVAAIGALVDLEGVVGIKDGSGDVDILRVAQEAAAARGRNDFAVFNGMPFAELHDRLYRAAGVTRYSSSTFVMAPEIANSYRAATESGDDEQVGRLVDGFFAPLDRLRRRADGYNISLVKAMVAAEGFDVGPVRPPLPSPHEDDVADVRRLLDAGRELVG